MLLSACGSRVPRLEHLPPGDERIVAELRAAIEQDEHLPSEAIEIESRDGVLVLLGFLGSRDQVRRALDLAGRVGGVRRVVNRLRVLPGGRSAGERPAASC